MGQIKTRLLTVFYLYLVYSSSTAYILGEFPSIRPVPCQNRMTGETGVCTFNWSCVNVAHGVHIGPCVDRFFVGTCCKIPANSNFTPNPTITSSYGATEANKDSKVESFSEITTTAERFTTKQKVKIPIPEKININHTINSQVHPEYDVETRKSTTFSDGISDSYLQPEIPITFFKPELLPIAPSSSLNRKPVLLHTSTSSTSNNFGTNAQISANHKSYFTPVYSDVKITTHSPFKEDSTTVHLQQQSSSILQSSHEQIHIPPFVNKSPLFPQFHIHQNPLISAESSHVSSSPSYTHETKNDKWTVPDEKIDTHHISIVLDGSIQHSPQVGQHEDIISNNTFLNWAYSFLSNGDKNETKSENVTFTEVKQNSSILPSLNISEVPNPSHPLISGTQKYDLILNNESASDFTVNEIDSTSTIKTSSEQGISVHIDNVSLNLTKYTEPAYPWPSPKPHTSKEPTSSTTEGVILRNVSRVCGRARSNIMARIVGGRKSHYLRWPWMISLRRFEGKSFKHKCGAALLNQLWAVTAAHCVDGKMPNDVMLRLGEYNFHRLDEFHPHIERRIYMIVIHPEFDPATYENDLALLRFYEPVQFQANIVPVCLPKFTGDIAGRTAVVTGWGRLSEEGELPGSLHEVHMPILTNKECEEMYTQAGYSETIRDVFVCAGLMSGGLDACEGDSGGPMVVKGDRGEWTLVGLISWGMGCAAPRQPGVYTRITKFVDWIDEIITY